MSDALQDDLLSTVLSAYQLQAGIYDNPTFCGHWQHNTTGFRRAAFHLIGSGACWLHTHESAEPMQMHAGDLVVLPHDAWHMLTADPVLEGEAPRRIFDGDGPFTTMVCGYFDFRAGGRNPVLAALPEVIVVDREAGGSAMQGLSQLLLSEAACAEVGTRTVLDKLADTLFVMTVRYFVNQSSDLRGVLAGLADARLRKALAVMHREPGKAWTLDILAREAGMSRSAFAQHFAERVGAPPIDYLTRWRMTQAELMLRDPAVSVARVAEQMGYETEAAFRKAFKRIHGVGPGSIRRWFREKLID